MSNQTVQVLEVRSLHPKVPAADVVDSLVVDHEGAVGVLQGGVGGQDGVVRLDDGDRSLGSGVNTELQLALLAVINGQALHEESTESRTSTTTERVEDQESLETGAAVGDAANLVKDTINELLSDSVVTTGVVVGGILLARDHLLWVEEVAVGASADLIDNIGLEVDIDGTGNIFALTYGG